MKQQSTLEQKRSITLKNNHFESAGQSRLIAFDSKLVVTVKNV